ncbi:hypothetical protein C7964_103812 [Loktanella sp. PT4BL]|jgi:hypothetical protein|uniref:hypothetical protein n=1 Tax=Loktanella sp. PT4BL TaxID=2135611 RepID=UPI000D7650FE|nr:hypothetical protein [Loktanella sp. PT4BL]PXW69292.1 hypothetical protein C7964_103812 [Loktanella sp. PT4BL]
MDQSARVKFFERIEAAPLAARGFFESVDEHFRQRNDVDVRFTHTTFADMRLWAVWETDNGKQREQIFATMTWQPKNLAVFARTKLTPPEFAYLGFEGAEKPKADSEPQNSDIRLFEEDWRYGALPFIRALAAAKMKILN